jgi:hypothetical protein
VLFHKLDADDLYQPTSTQRKEQFFRTMQQRLGRIVELDPSSLAVPREMKEKQIGYTVSPVWVQGRRGQYDLQVEGAREGFHELRSLYLGDMRLRVPPVVRRRYDGSSFTCEDNLGGDPSLARHL